MITNRAPFMDSRVLITGGLGFIGSNLAINLAKAGASVTVIDNSYHDGGANEFNIHPLEESIKVVPLDMGTFEGLREVVDNSDYVFDLAAQVSHVESMVNPALDLTMNCLAHLPLLEACRTSKANPRIVYTGSRVQYGRIKKIPVTENHPIEPIDNNGISKHACEQYHLLYHKAYGLRTVSLRLTNTYGPRNVMRHPKQGFVNWFVRLCIDGTPIEIYGNGNQLREFTYVDDAVEACALAATQEVVGKAYNVGGFRSSVRDVADALLKIRPGTRIVARPFPEERKTIEIGDYISDYSLFSKATGWKPTITLMEGLRRTLEYYEEFKNRYW